MNRLIKFRAWNPEVKTMNLPSRNMLIESYDGSAMWKFGYENLDPMNVILMQFTGLLDKNGKEIYEGDIVDRNIGNSLIGFYEGAFCVMEDENEPIAHYEIGAWKIVGNIYENPDLLTNNQ